jgi:hypothetical protein
MRNRIEQRTNFTSLSTPRHKVHSTYCWTCNIDRKMRRLIPPEAVSATCSLARPPIVSRRRVHSAHCMIRELDCSMCASEVLCRTKCGTGNVMLDKVGNPQPCAKSRKSNCGVQVGDAKVSHVHAKQFSAVYKSASKRNWTPIVCTVKRSVVRMRRSLSPTLF